MHLTRKSRLLLFILCWIETDGYLLIHERNDSTVRAALINEVARDRKPPVYTNDTGSHDYKSEAQIQNVTLYSRGNGKHCVLPTLSDTSHFKSAPQIDIKKVFGSHETNKKPEGIIELLVVIDKNLSDAFKNDKEKILEYLSVYFWDINLRFQTLPDVSLTFQINDLILIKDVEDQYFIERAKRPDGTTNYERVLDYFNYWLYSRAPKSTPDYDLAALFTNAIDNKAIGMTTENAACKLHQKYGGGIVIYDTGSWDGVTTTAHEIAHALGAPHDNDEQAPCKDGDFIMKVWGLNSQRWFFSKCTNNAIKEFMRLPEADCLKTSNTREKHPLYPSPFGYPVQVPSRNEQCQRRFNNSDAFATAGQSNDCLNVHCTLLDGTNRLIELDLDGTLCSRHNERCFRGSCRKKGNLIANVGSGQCIFTQDKFQSVSLVILSPCPDSKMASPLDGFLIMKNNFGKALATPFYNRQTGKSEEACLKLKSAFLKKGNLETTQCDPDDSKQAWDFLSLGKSKYLIRHYESGGCLKQEGSSITVHTGCTSKRHDTNMQWKLQ